MVNCTEPTFSIESVFDTPEELRAKANTIHVVFGCFLVAKSVVWSMYTSRCNFRVLFCLVPSRVLAWFCPSSLAVRLRTPIIKSDPAAFVLSGVLFMSSGLYLLLMVFFFLRADRLPGLWHFALHDITQVQHVAVGVCLMGHGASEIAFAATRPASEATRTKWHAATFVNGALVGLVFTVHPQKSDEMTSLHISLGACLFFGHFCWFVLKLLAFRKDRGAMFFEMAAGCAYGIACINLFSYHEPHYTLVGMKAECSPALPLTRAAIAVGVFTTVVSLALVLRVAVRACRSRTQRYKRQRLISIPT